MLNQSLSHRRSRGARARLWSGRVWRVLTDPDRFPLYFVLAALITFLVECLSRHSVAGALHFALGSPLAYLSNYAIVLAVTLLGILIPKRVAGLCLTSSIWLILGIIQFVVLSMRVSPLTAEDIAIVLSVLTIISAYLTTWQMVLIVIAALAVIAALVLLFIRCRRHEVRWRPFLKVYPLTLLVSAAVIAAAFGTGQLSGRFPNLANAFQDYGFPYCFSMSIVDRGVDRPPDYDEGYMSDILEELTTEPPSEGVTAPPADLPAGNGPNVIVLQLESFFDVGYLEGVTFSEDPTPTFTALKEQYPSGLLNVPVIGAGTINTEFEVLTGMSVADFGAGEYPYRSALAEGTCESLAYDLLYSGYATHAIHNHQGSFYLRNEVYANLGFETFTSIEYFKEVAFNENNWALDALLTDEILYLLESTEESDLVFAVSVQGHGKYPDEYIPKEGDILVTDGIEDEAVRSHFNYFVNQLREMDAFVAALCEAVMALEEDTVLLLYGDHLPSIAMDEGITLSTGMLQTEYVIVTNYDAPAPAVTGELHTYELFPILLEMVDVDEGVMNRFHRAYRDNENYLKLLTALSYDVLYGERIAYGRETYPVMELVMGSRPITVTECYDKGVYLYVKGQNFTTYSRVVVDGREMEETVYLSDGLLRIPLDELPMHIGIHDTDYEISVRQVTAKGDMLSETPAILYDTQRTERAESTMRRYRLP